MFRLAALVCGLVSAAAAKTVPIATFDGAPGTTWDWEAVNDPVMGGKSQSTFKVDTGRKLGIWDGQVAIVPFLHAPGFCHLQAPGRRKKAAFPDLSDVGGLSVRMRETYKNGLRRFSVMLMTKGARCFGPHCDVYTASFNLKPAEGDTMEEHFLSWSSFICTRMGHKVDGCPPLTRKLSQVTSVGIGTSGKAGKFDVEIERIFGSSAPSDGDGPIDLATVDGSPKASKALKSTATLLI